MFKRKNGTAGSLRVWPKWLSATVVVRNTSDFYK